MKKPAFQPANPTGYQSQIGSVPAPIGGWNTRDAIAAMPPTDATILDNFFPSSTSVDLRKGSATFATGFATRVQSLLSYASGTKKELFGADNTGIYDITAGGAIGAAKTVLTNGYCQWINFSNAAGSFLLSVNGTDNLKLYDGTTWTTVTGVSSPAITGIVTSDIVHINAFKNRVWFVKKNSLNPWYLPATFISGAASEFAISGLFTRGGSLAAIGTWTIDGGAGVDDFIVFATTEGEIAVYQGTDPSSPTTFALVGVYFIGEPIGRRCFTKYGGDLLFMCKQGLFPLSAALQTASINRTTGLSDKISPTFNDSAVTYGSNQGWETTIFPTGNMLLVNVPAFVGTASYQYCMNLITQSWCRFTDWNSACFYVWNNRLFFGSETSVVEAWVTTADNGNFITGIGLTAYSYMDYPGTKHFQMMRPMIQTDSGYDLYMGVSVDFQDTTDYSVISNSVSGGSLWDVALWDVALWGAGSMVAKQWNSVNVNDGTAVAAKIQVRTSLSSIKWQSTDYTYCKGGYI